MPATLKDSKLTDFFQRRPSLSSSSQFSAISSPLSPVSSQSLSGGNSRPLAPPKRKPGRPKETGKKAKDRRDQGTSVAYKRAYDRSEHSVLESLVPCSSPFRTSDSNAPAKRQMGKRKGEKKGALRGSKDAHPLRSSFEVDPHDFASPSPLNSASRLRLRVLSGSSESNSSRALTPSKRKLDDNDDIVEITRSGVPLSLSHAPRQLSSPDSSELPTSLLSSLSSSNKRRRYTSPRATRNLSELVTPKRTRGTRNTIPTSQSSELGVYTPVRPNSVSQCRNDTQESVENWRHGRSTYRLEIVSPLQYSPGDYSMEIDRPLSPLTSCPHSTIPGSPLSSFTELDALHPEVEPDDLNPPLPSPSSGRKILPSPTQMELLLPVRPVTPPPSSPEQEQSMPAPVAPKDSKMRTAEILAEIWANVRAKSVSDSEDSYPHAPILDELSSEEEEDEPFWKRDKLTSYGTQRSTVTGSTRTRLCPPLPSPSSPSPSELSTSLDESLPTKYDGHSCHIPDLPVSDPGSPLDDIHKRPTRTRRPVTRVIKPLASETKPGAGKACPINALLRERSKETQTGRGIDAVNRAEGYDQDTLLSDFSIDEVDEDVGNVAPGTSSPMDKKVPRAAASGPNDNVNLTANALEVEVHQEERERLLGAKEGEAVGRILDADRKLGQSVDHGVLGVSVFVDDHEGNVDIDDGSEAGPVWESAKEKTATLERLSEAIEKQDIDYLQAVFGILSDEDMVVPGVARWLCEQALWHKHEHLGRFSRKFLLEMPLWMQSYPSSPLSVDLIVLTLMRLGLRKDWSTLVLPPQDAIFQRLQNRSRVLGSLVKMISSFVTRWRMEQLPNVVIVLLLIGVDMDTSTELRRDILHSVSLLCSRLPGRPEDIEISIAQKALDLAKSLSPTNQVLLLSFFTKGSPSSLRIARVVAHHVLTDSTIQPTSYALPPLDPLISVLSDEPFSITDSTDYDALTSRIAVLSVALSGIESYVAEENVLRKMAHPAVTEGSPRKKGLMPLELVKTRLDAMHGKIVDTRAAHLDRSRTKGAIQRLSMRVHYQRAALSKTGGQLRLGSFFSPGINSRRPKHKTR